MKIDFEFETSYGIFRDALYLPDDHELTEGQITAMQVERLNNWLYFVENPPQINSGYVEINGVAYEKIDIDGQIVLKPVEA